MGEEDVDVYRRKERNGVRSGSEGASTTMTDVLAVQQATSRAMCVERRVLSSRIQMMAASPTHVSGHATTPRDWLPA